MKSKTLRYIVTFSCLISCLILCARGDAQSDPRPKPAEQVYKNIEVLNGLPAADVDGVMIFMSAALGVGCTHCHVNPWDSDEKSAKIAARKMIAMTRSINKENFSGNPAVTCYTCHRGQHNTQPLPTVEIATATTVDATEVPNTNEKLPSIDAVIEKYVTAIGGLQAINKLKTRVSRGTETTSNRMTPPQTTQLEMTQTSANRFLTVRTQSKSETRELSDGTRFWQINARVTRELEGRELAEALRDANFFRYLKLRDTYPQMRVLTKERLGNREAYVVGATSRDDSRERLYFDSHNGLLIRRYVSFRTAFGAVPEVTDFDDYRSVDGIKHPFRISWSRPPFSSVRSFTEIRLNAPIDDTIFRLPG